MEPCALSRLAELCYLFMRKHHHHHDLVSGEMLHDSINLKTSLIDGHDYESRLPLGI